MKKCDYFCPPETKNGDVPVWCHHHCTKMRIDTSNENLEFFILTGSAASLKITCAGTGKYVVLWEVIHSPAERASGSVVFTKDQLRAAFGLSDLSGDFGGWLIDRFGASSAEQGKYIRWNDYLNIPCPGTGNDGDPNISIFLDDDIKLAVQQFLI